MGSGFAISSEAFCMSPFLEVVPLKIKNHDIPYIFCKDISKPKSDYFFCVMTIFFTVFPQFFLKEKSKP